MEDKQFFRPPDIEADKKELRADAQHFLTTGQVPSSLDEQDILNSTDPVKLFEDEEQLFWENIGRLAVILKDIKNA